MDASRWQGCVRDDVFLHHLRLPQAHDAATGLIRTGGPNSWKISEERFTPCRLVSPETARMWAQTQDLNIQEQLLSGIRSLDLRVWVPQEVDVHPHFHHGCVLIPVSLECVLTQVKTFLCVLNKPSEFVYVHIRTSGPGNKARAQDVIKTVLESCVVNQKDAEKVSDVRGKVVLFSDLDHNNPPMFSYPRTQDGDIVRKWHDFENRYIPYFPRDDDQNQEKLFVIQAHPQVDFWTIVWSGYESLEGLARAFNSDAKNWFAEKKNQDRKLNVIEFDYWDVSMAELFLRPLNEDHLNH